MLEIREFRCRKFFVVALVDRSIDRSIYLSVGPRCIAKRFDLALDPKSRPKRTESLYSSFSRDKMPTTWFIM